MSARTLDPARLIRHYADSHDPDQRTSMADARIALCLKLGVAMDDIDPASGYNHSRDAYDSVRASWIWHIEQHGFNDFYDREPLEKAFAAWTRHRPQFTAGDNWLAAGRAAHRAHWAAINVTCSHYGVCDICTTDDEHADVERLEAAGRTPDEIWEITGFARCTGCGHLMRTPTLTTLPDHYCTHRQEQRRRENHA